jgi:hypothetical protein
VIGPCIGLSALKLRHNFAALEDFLAILKSWRSHVWSVSDTIGKKSISNTRLPKGNCEWGA